MNRLPTLLIFVLLCASPSLLGAAPAPVVRHWPQLPVRVFIFAKGPELAQEAQIVLAGLEEWVSASHGKIRYLRVADPGEADITVRLETGRFLSGNSKSDDTKSAAMKTVGETTVLSSGLILKKASIRLAEGVMDPEDLQTAAAHEIGHALGIQGHSDDPDDLMFPVETLHSPVRDARFPDAPHSVTAHDLRLLSAGYPLLLASVRP